MRKYDFSKYELWFSFRALQALVGASRESFERFVKRVWRNMMTKSKNKADDWESDEIYLSRKEGKRDVARMTQIYSLRTSCEIVSEYKKNRLPNYSAILERFKFLQERSNEGYLKRFSEIKKKNEGMFDFLYEDNLDGDMGRLADLLSVYGIEKDMKRKRIILDLRKGIFKLVLENDNVRDGKIAYKTAKVNIPYF